MSNKKIFLTTSIFSSSSLFSSSPLYLPSPTIPFLLSQHPSPYSFYLSAYLVSLEPQTFGFPLYSCPDALPVSHGDLDASSPTLFFLITFSLNYSNQTCILDLVLLRPKSKHYRLCWFHLHIILTVMDKSTLVSTNLNYMYI